MLTLKEEQQNAKIDELAKSVIKVFPADGRPISNHEISQSPITWNLFYWSGRFYYNGGNIFFGF